MMTDERRDAERRALVEKFPRRRFAFVWDREPRLEIILPVKQFNAVYKAKLYGLDRFPEEPPRVTPGVLLRDSRGRWMNEPSRANHLLGTYNGETWLCIYSYWDPMCSLVKTATRTGIWLTAYHCHLQTGRNLECYLPH